jgi:arabinofuranosyltransferase
MNPAPIASPSPAAEASRQRLLLLGVLLMLFAFSALLFSSYTCDDSYITFRYAEHAAQGQGLVFNPGERVEGYSNPLWLGLLVVALKLGLSAVGTAKALGLLSGLGALLFSYGIVMRLTAGPTGVSGVPTAAGAKSPSPEAERHSGTGLWPPLVVLPLITAGLAYYSVSGLETPLYACLVTGAVYCLMLPGAAAQWLVAALALAAALTRPEGLLVMVALLGWRGLCLRQFDQLQKRAIVASTALALAGLAAFFIWRHSYFGSWLPNTYYAKPPGAFGGDSLLYPLGYLRDFFVQTGAWLWLALALVWLRPRWLAAGALLLVTGVEMALVIHARGDWMALHRFLLPALPLLVAFGYAGLLRVMPSKLVIGGLLALAVILNVIQIAEQRRDFRSGQYPQSVMAGQPQEQAGRWLKQHFPPDTLLACKRIGGVAYFSGMRMVDMLGLVDRKIAMIRHESADRGEAEQTAMAEEIFRRKPDVILLSVLKRWDKIPQNQPPPDLASNLRDVDNAVYERLEKYGYRFIYRLPQGGTGEFVVYARQGLRFVP